ncbi:MAG: Hint domain-containing protein [Acetobacter sp.]|nr:Hint domain-containing protein [Acetobacter sp.]MCH4060586.1 Hint domain-containing protein [Acetobacter sp.]MCH4087526.1 Hint domain-containing protein [Acetobacter sp.]MCI1294944.1 Hint domain-containing protein [Acetobacter sp.]MCI1321524.1 Hint domain-containing protein [Acetobacter sp.]
MNQIATILGIPSDSIRTENALITSEHCLFFDGKFVPARMLVNGRSIFYDTSILSYDYYHIETEDHSVVMADGMLTESYLDTGNRHLFSQKENVVSIGGSRNLSWDDAAAPLSVSREVVEPIFHMIKSRADQKAYPFQTESQSLTHESGLYLLTDTGAIIRQISEKEDQAVFMIPPYIKRVRLVSNASRPCDVVGPFIDDRRQLGLLVGDVVLFEGNKTTTLSAHLREVDLPGWNNIEDGTMRWTTGNALLNLKERSPGSIALMAIQIHAAGPYLVTNTPSEIMALHA